MSRRLIVFARAPIAGQVKTRLIPALGGEGAAQLHESLVRHCVLRTTNARHWKTELHCTPDVNHTFFEQLTQKGAIDRYGQSSGDLGRRMFAALSAALERAEQVVLVGTDCPMLCAADIQEAFQALDTGNDAVFGPAEDGGYYLIGLRRADGRLFADISWGSDKVMDVTRSRLKELAWSWAEVTERWDVDRPEDIRRLGLDPDLRTLLPVPQKGTRQTAG